MADVIDFVSIKERLAEADAIIKQIQDQIETTTDTGEWFRLDWIGGHLAQASRRLQRAKQIAEMAGQPDDN